jgi:hypothetical protein
MQSIRNLTVFKYIAISAIVTCPTSVFAKENSANSSISFDASTGAKYITNVYNDELDSNSAVSDYARLIDLGISYQSKIRKKTKLNFGYSLSDIDHEKLDGFDLRTQLLTANLSHSFNQLKTGLAYRYAASSLDNDSFLTLSQVSPSLSRNFGKKVFGRLAYTYSQKDLNDNDEKDADSDLLDVDIYYFVNGVKSYYSLGYRFKDEVANDSVFDYQSHRIKTGYSKKFQFLNDWGKLKLALQYEERYYDNFNNDLMDKRKDRRTSLRSSLSLPISSSVYIALDYEYSHYTSNLDSSDFDNNEASLQVGFQY